MFSRISIGFIEFYSVIPPAWAVYIFRTYCGKTAKELCMKNTIKVFGNLNRTRRVKVPLLIIAIVAVIGFSMAACEEPGPPEEYEATTSGRLIVTGLGAYNGQTIYISNLDFDNPNAPIPLGSAINGYNPSSETSYVVRYSLEVTIASGQAVYKVFVYKGNQKGKGKGGFQSYTGNDQNVWFSFGDVFDNEGNYVTGSVTVNFTNGQATGAFVPD
jgi:hypothetical protein